MIKPEYIKNYKNRSDLNKSIKVATHDGEFHADEVVAVSLIKFVFGNVKLTRSRDLSKIEKADIVIDVGGEYNSKNQRFDHHQKSYSGNLASAGMILKWLKDEGMLDAKFTNHLNNVFIRGVDLQDIGKYHPQRGFCSFSTVISSFNPLYNNSDKNYMKKFKEAVKFTIKFLESIKEKYIETKKFKHKFMQILEKTSSFQNGVLVLDEYLPWKEFIYDNSKCNDLLFVVMPASKNKWLISSIPVSPKKPYSDRLKLPLSWAGLLEGDFYKETGIKGAIFCHKQRFLAAFKDKKSALKAALIAIKEAKH